jgi:diacylglycerol kinase (ATP)
MDTPLSNETQTLVSLTTPYTAVIINNPNSGSFPHHHPDHQNTLAFLKDHGWQVEIWPTRGPGDAQILAQQAVEQNLQVVIVAGGDGTINEVVQGLAGSETALGILPTGTVNVWALETGIPLDITKAREILVQGQIRRIDLGRVNERYFLLMVGIGIDGEVTLAVERKPLKRLGKLGYALAALWFGPGYLAFPVTIKLDSAPPIRTHALQIIVGNTQLYAGTLKFTWQARCDDSLLDLCVVHQRNLWGRLIVLRDFILRREQRRLWVRYNTFQEMLLETPKPVAIQIDGDPAGYTPVLFSVAPGALKVIVPTEVPAELFS